MRVKLFMFFFFLLPFFQVYSQNGFIRGAVFDAATGEYLPGVTVLVPGTTNGTITDLDGQFSLSVAPGVYILNLSFISYETLKINDIKVGQGEVVTLGDLSLKEASIELSEITVTAEAVRNTENALLTLKQKSVGVIDGISSTNFRKMGDSDAASSMKRVTGVSVEGGKYVYVRGLGDRYTKTIMNGLDIPGLDPDRNTLQMDIFPTSVIDNIVVHKSFSAELPADFTGGVIDITIKDFPEEKISSISFGFGYNPAMHFNNHYLAYEGGATDFLGFDDGAREIPATSDIPFFSQVVGNPYGEKGLRYREILENFNPTLAAHEQQSLMDFELGYFTGNQTAFGKKSLGYNLSLSYKNTSEYYEDAEFARFGLSGNPDVTEMENREFQSGNFGVNTVLISGLAGLSMKTSMSKYSLDLLHLQNGESRAGIFDYRNADQGAVFYGFQHNLDYSQRSLSNLMIRGKHNFMDKEWELEWKISPTLSKISDPDIRFTRYEDRDGAYSIGTEVGFPERIWRDLSERNLSGVIHAAKNFSFAGRKSKFRFGGAYTYKVRDFEIQNFALNIRNLSLTGNPDELFYPENLWPMEGSQSSGTTYEAAFIPTNPNKFNSSINNAAGYLSVDLEPVSHLKTILGLRLENYVQKYTGQDQLGFNVLDNDVVLEQLGFFPAANIIYSISEKQNLRFSFSKTIARPSFKELSYAEIYDPVTGRTFIGGLFRDANDFAGIEYWDGNLVSTDIFNYDLRWEYFGLNGQMFSVSAFYKEFINPIEMVQFATQTGSFQPRNVGDGEVLGAETELRLNGGTLTRSLEKMKFIFNFTLTGSRIQLSSTELQSRRENARTGQTIDEYRVMAGQAPYIINSGIAYEGGETGPLKNLEAGLYYNVQGSTLLYAGIADRPDIYSKPFHSLNFNSNKSIGKQKKIQVGLKIENILNSSKESVFESFNASEQYFERLSAGTHFKIRAAYKFF
ncbi:MAG: TonB-dependent receptor [Bacteroidales bacterium]|nr:TonB-dependent receptor [Bacteroidales bacterium]